MKLFLCEWLEKREDCCQLVYAKDARQAKSTVRNIEFDNPQPIRFLTARPLNSEAELRDCPLFWADEANIFVEDARDYADEPWSWDSHGGFLPCLLPALREQWRQEANAAEEARCQLALPGLVRAR